MKTKKYIYFIVGASTLLWLSSCGSSSRINEGIVDYIENNTTVYYLKNELGNGVSGVNVECDGGFLETDENGSIGRVINNSTDCSFNITHINPADMQLYIYDEDGGVEGIPYNCDHGDFETEADGEFFFERADICDFKF